MPEVTALGLVPVKGMRFVPAESLELTAEGARGDRAFFPVDAGTGKLLQTSRNPRLLGVVPRWDGETLALTFPDGTTVEDAVVPGDLHTIHNYEGREIRGRLVDNAATAALSAHLGRKVRLMTREPGQLGADDFAVTLMGTPTLGALGEHLGEEALDGRRFRMNVTVDGTAPWEEHGWGGRELAVGEAVLRGVDPVVRCVVTMRDPDTGKGDVPVLRGLAELRGKRDVTFGLWCEVVTPGVVRVGDEVRVA